jgi:hypothetical protein
MPVPEFAFQSYSSAPPSSAVAVTSFEAWLFQGVLVDVSFRFELPVEYPLQIFVVLEE